MRRLPSVLIQMFLWTRTKTHFRLDLIAAVSLLALSGRPSSWPQEVPKPGTPYYPQVGQRFHLSRDFLVPHSGNDLFHQEATALCTISVRLLYVYYRTFAICLAGPVSVAPRLSDMDLSRSSRSSSGIDR